MGLTRYFERRNLKHSGEPGDDAKEHDAPIFVIHEHKASNHHFDFRLECDGVLKSWAVPKGLSTDPREKRLAVETEDHPLAYASFEGVIPEGEYGAGPVLLWDEGPFDNATRQEGRPVTLTRALEDGFAEIRLHGHKLCGGYVLKKFDSAEGDDKWLIIKKADDEADARRNPVSTEPQSVKSGRKIDELKEQDQ